MELQAKNRAIDRAAVRTRGNAWAVAIVPGTSRSKTCTAPTISQREIIGLACPWPLGLRRHTHSPGQL